MNRFTMMICAVLIAAISWAGPLNAAPADKTEICHFKNHWAHFYYEPEFKWYTVFDWIIQGDGTDCLDAGGTIIEVPDKAMKGHRVNADQLFPGDLDKCIICHYPSHVNELDWFDSVLTNGAGGACFDNGGKVMVISCSALDGHNTFCPYDFPGYEDCPYNPDNPYWE